MPQGTLARGEVAAAFLISVSDTRKLLHLLTLPYYTGADREH